MLRTVKDTKPSPESAAPAVQPAPASADPVARVVGSAGDEASLTNADKTRSRKHRVLALVGVAAVLAALAFGGRWWLVGRFLVATDDAYVGADIAQISARVAGRIVAVPVPTNQHVRKGEVLLGLEDTDYRLAVDQAKAKLATQQAAIARIGRQIEASRAAAVQAKAQLSAAEAELARAEADFARVRSLANKNYSSIAALDTSRANRDKAQAALLAAKAGTTSAEANVAVLEAQQTEAQRLAAELEVAVAKAKWDLDATKVRAPIDGYLGNKSVQIGDYVTPGKRLAALVPDDAVYVDANFKETQLAGIRPGAVAYISVDAAAGETIEGKVVSIAPAAGSQFSLLPPENATGNFTKIVQRVPVRIAVPRAFVERGILRPGLSVVATVDIRTGSADATPRGLEPPGPTETSRASGAAQ